MPVQEEHQEFITRCADTLIVRDDYFELTSPEIFLEWAVETYQDPNSLTYSDSDNFDVNDMFDKWKGLQCVSMTLR